MFGFCALFWYLKLTLKLCFRFIFINSKHVLPTADPTIINLTKQKRVTYQPKLAYNVSPPPPGILYKYFGRFYVKPSKCPNRSVATQITPDKVFGWLQINFWPKKCRHILFLKMHKGIEFLQQTQIFQSLYLSSLMV